MISVKNNMKQLLKEKKKIDKKAQKLIDMSLKTSWNAKRANKKMMKDAMTIYPDEYRQIYSDMEKILKEK